MSAKLNFQLNQLKELKTGFVIGSNPTLSYEMY